MYRIAKATMAAVLLSAAFAVSAAQATPTVNTDNPGAPARAVFQDTGVPSSTTDNLSITATDLGSTVRFVFSNPGVNMTTLDVANCTGNNTPTITCTVTESATPGDNGVDVTLGAAGGTDMVQSVQLVTPVSNSAWGATANNLTGGATKDTMNGNAGADTFIGGAAGDSFDGKLGTDTVSYSDKSAAVLAAIDDTEDSGTGCPDNCEGDLIAGTIENLIGGSAADNLTGSSGVNVLDGAAGNDVLNGLAGADTLFGRAGDDTLIGGADDDTLNGGAVDSESDTISYLDAGRATGVTVNLDPGATVNMTSGTEHDVIVDNTIENITGSVFDDTLQGWSAVNVLKGEAGNDILLGDSNDPGADPRVSADEAFGGSGTDTFSYADNRHGTGVDASLDDVANDGLPDTDSGTSGNQGEGDNLHADIENLTGTVGADTLSGTTGANVFAGGTNSGGAVDTISYRGRTDGITATLADMTGPDGDTFTGSAVRKLTGGGGNDTLVGDGNPNTLDGAAGNDTLVGAGGNDILVGGVGSNTADYSRDSRGTGIDADLSAGQQSVHAGAAEDTLSGIQNLIGTDKVDELTGNTGPNVLVGGAGDDKLDGSSGDDSLDGGTGSDQILGGTGVDTATYASRTAALTITIDAAAGDGEAGENDKVFPSIENVIGGSGNDTITATSLDNVVDGGGGDDTISTLAGNDTITGGTGKDSISAGEGNDTVKILDQFADAETSCGAGSDTVDADVVDPINADCETVKRTAIPQPPAGPAASTVSVDNPSVAEGSSGATVLTFTVTLDAAQAAAVSVPVATTDLTAKAGSDYTTVTATLDFAPGETSKTVAVPVAADKIVEKDETLGLGLGTPTGNAKLGTPGYGIGTIVNDDKAVSKTKKRPKVTMSVSPSRDTTAPYSFTVTGKLARPKGVSAKRGCTGRVRLQAKGPKKTLKTVTTKLRSSCRYAATVSFTKTKGVGPSGKVKITAKFLGNKALKSKAGPTRTVRIK